jgi:hypothetical protein
MKEEKMFFVTIQDSFYIEAETEELARMYAKDGFDLDKAEIIAEVEK